MVSLRILTLLVHLSLQLRFVLNVNLPLTSDGGKIDWSQSALVDNLFVDDSLRDPSVIRTNRLVRSPQSDSELIPEGESHEFVDEFNIDPRKNLNEEQDVDPRKKVNQHEASINTKLSTDKDNKESKPSSARTKAKVGEVLLPEDYNVNEIPRLTINGTLAQVPVVQIFTIRSLLDLDEVNEKIVVDADTIVTWADGNLFDDSLDHTLNNSRTGFDSWRTLNPIFLKRIWTPDIYIDSLLRVDKPSYLSAPVALKFNQALGYFRYRSRITLTLKCPMEFHYYPADTQKCLFFFKSYAYFSEELELGWAYQGAFFANPSDANFDIQIDDVTAEKKGEKYPDRIRTYDVLQFNVVARRKLSYHLIQTYVPSVFFIIITWLTFLLPPSMVEVRIGIAMTTLLTLTAMFSSVRESTPSVSYTKAIDIWMIVCVFFVFLTLLEFAVLAWLETDKKKKEKEDDDNAEQEKKRRPSTNGAPSGREIEAFEVEEKRKERDHKFWANVGYGIERFAFPIFAGLFVIFVTVYWTWLLLAAEYFSWEINRTHNIFEEDIMKAFKS